MSQSFMPKKLAALVIAVGVIAAACGGGTSTSTVAPAASASGATAGAATGTLPKPELSTIRIGISAPTEPVQFAQKLADSFGIYQKYGITNVTVTGFEGDAKALQALVAGQLDFFVGGASTAINSVLSDTPVKVLSMNSVVLTDGLWCQKDIKTAADVKGKSVAISTFGGTSHGSALVAIKGIGLTPKDVVITQVGNEGTRTAALRGGSIACAVLDMGNEPLLTPLGFNVVTDNRKTKIQWGRSGLMARADFIQKNPNTVLVVVASTLEAQQAMFTDTKNATAKFVEFTQAKPDTADVQMQSFLGYGSRSMLFSDEAFINPRDVLAALNPAVANVEVSKAYDLSFLKKLVEIGFYTKVGAPTT